MNIINGRKTVTTVGTALALASTNTPVQYLVITPLSTNTGVCAIGSSTAKATAGSESGVVLKAGNNPIELHDIDLAQVFVDASVTTEGITWTAIY